MALSFVCWCPRASVFESKTNTLATPVYVLTQLPHCSRRCRRRPLPCNFSLNCVNFSSWQLLFFAISSLSHVLFLSTFFSSTLLSAVISASSFSPSLSVSYIVFRTSLYHCRLIILRLYVVNNFPVYFTTFPSYITETHS